MTSTKTNVAEEAKKGEKQLYKISASLNSSESWNRLNDGEHWTLSVDLGYFLGNKEELVKYTTDHIEEAMNLLLKLDRVKTWYAFNQWLRGKRRYRPKYMIREEVNDYSLCFTFETKNKRYIVPTIDFEIEEYCANNEEKVKIIDFENITKKLAVFDYLKK